MLLNYKTNTLSEVSAKAICAGLNKISWVSAKLENNDISYNISIQIQDDIKPQDILDIGALCNMLDK